MANPARWQPSLRRRFAVWFGLVFMLGAVGLRVMYYRATAASLARDLDVEIRGLLDVVEVQKRLTPNRPLTLPEDAREFGGFAGAWTATGAVLDAAGVPPGVIWDRAWPERAGRFWTTPDNRHRLTAAGAADGTLVVAGASLGPLAAAKRNEALFEIGTFVLWVPIVLGVAWLMLSQVLVPVAAIAATARRIRAGCFQERIDATNTDGEFREMAETINAMLDRLEAIRESQSRFNADLAHQLMNPVHAILLESETAAARPDTSAAVGESLDRIEGLARRIEGTCEVLLAYARSAAIDPGRLQPIDLEPVIAAAIERIAPAASARGVAIAAPAAGVVVRGDAALLEEVFANLLSNAVEHSFAAGVIEIVLESGVHDCSVGIVDHGAGVPADAIPRLFERFATSHPVGGHGIGLALSRLIARSHGGDVLHAPTIGGGATFVVRLPRPA